MKTTENAMQRLATLLIVAFLNVVVADAADPKTPKPLVGRWAAVQLDSQGEQVALDEIQVEFEFTSSQLLLQIDGPKPTHVYDCYSTAGNGLLMLDLKSAADSPGPEKGLHVRAIYKIDGDTLTVCSRHSDDPKMLPVRPTGFVSSTETKSNLYVLKRIRLDK